MSLSRRGFLTGMLALGAAPAIVRAASLMKVVTPAGLLVPEVRGIVTASDPLGQRRFEASNDGGETWYGISTNIRNHKQLVDQILFDGLVFGTVLTRVRHG